MNTPWLASICVICKINKLILKKLKKGKKLLQQKPKQKLK